MCEVYFCVRWVIVSLCCLKRCKKGGFFKFGSSNLKNYVKKKKEKNYY